MPTARPGRPKSQEKKSAILDAASELFLHKGVTQTSMEEVARVSGVSKQTVYSHYKNKDALFSAVIARKCDEYKIRPEHLADHGGCIETALTMIAEKFIALFHDKDVIAMYAVVIGEAKNTPRVAELFYQAGPSAGLNALTGILIELSEQKLDETAARHLATDFFNLLKGEFHMRSLMRLPYALDEQEKDTFINHLVKKTLCMYHHYY